MSTVEISEEVVAAEVNATVQAAQAIEVKTPEQAQAATEFLSKLAGAKRRNEQARLFIVGPLNTQVKAINERFKENAVPLDEADQLVRGKLLVFQQAEAERVRVEQEREDAERRERERAAREVQEREQAEARRVEQEQREAERRRHAELQEAQNERAREIAAMGEDELAFLLASGKDAELAHAERNARKERAEAEERADAARRRAEEATQVQIAEASAPSVSVPSTKLASASGSVATRKRWQAVVVDSALVPREYLVVDQKLINAAVKDGVREIPGVTIDQVEELAVRAR